MIPEGTGARPRGIVGAALTPFAAPATVDMGRLEVELDFLASHCHLVSVLGAEVSEVSVLDPAHRREVLRRAIGHLKGRVPVVAGGSSPSVGEVAELGHLAAAAGASFLQVLIPCRPWGGPATTGELVSYFTAVIEESDLPVIAYHNPGRGTDAGAEALIELSTIDGIVGFKESSRDMSKIARVAAEVDRAGRAAYLTTMQPLLASLEFGASGAMLPAPATLVAARVWAAFESGDHLEAARWQRCFAEFPGRLGRHGLAPVMKAAMAHLGLDLGAPAWPYPEPGTELRAEVGRLLDGAGVTDLARQADATLRPASASTVNDERGSARC